MQALIARYATPLIATLAFTALILLTLGIGAQRMYHAGLEAGRAEVRAAAERGRAVAAEAALGRLEERLQASNAAVDAYLATVQSRASRAYRGELDRYAQSQAGTGPCIDADGLRLLDAARNGNRPRDDPSGAGRARPAVRPTPAAGG